MELFRALRADSSFRAAVVGSGGKSTALFRLAEQLEAPVLLAASTHLSIEQCRLAGRHYVVTGSFDPRNYDLSGIQSVLFTGEGGADGRTAGLDFETLDQIHQLAGQLGRALILEADGSRRKPLKAPAGHEPAIPGWVKQVVVTAGLSGLEQPLREAVHRPEIFAALSSAELDGRVDAEALLRYLRHPAGGLKNIPSEADRIVLLNQADTDALQQVGARMAARLLPVYDRILVAALHQPGPEEVSEVHEPIAGVILAAGASRRLGRPKVMLDWRGYPFIWHVAQTALQSGLSPVIIVAGAEIESIQKAVESLSVQVIHNPAWEKGQSSSLRAGVAALPRQTGAAVFLLADQPQVKPELVKQLAGLHQRGLPPIAAPSVGGRRANPVLFDRVTFAELEAIQGDTGGRQLFQKYQSAWLPVDDESLLLDVDNEEDYQRLLRLPD